MENLDYKIALIRQTRKNFEYLIKKYSISQLNEIPDGFNNNLIWNYAHMLVTKQILCYKLSSNTPAIADELIESFKKGTKPEGFLDQGEVNKLISLSDEILDQFIEDYKSGQFATFKPYTTSYGVTLNDVNEALTFNLVHEGMHYGAGLALAKALNNQGESAL